MTEPTLSAQLDAAVDRLLSGKAAGPGKRTGALAALASLAGDLRDLPREQFRDRLRLELINTEFIEKGEHTTMEATATAVKEASYIREGFLTVTPYIIGKRGPEVYQFIKQAFGAEEKLLVTGLPSGMHAEARLGDSMIMLGGGPQFPLSDQLAALHYHVPDVDATYQRALDAGGTSIYQPTDHEYGERGCAVKDMAGNIWYIATVKGPSFHWPGVPQLQVYFHAVDAEKFMDFLARAFGAKVETPHKNPDGTLVHGMAWIGTSSVEASEARGPYQPLPTMLYMYVEDCDAAYDRALKAGCTSLHPLMDQPYGDRNGTVKDPWGNTWYLATHKGA